jgi:hypothetical protein
MKYLILTVAMGLMALPNDGSHRLSNSAYAHYLRLAPDNAFGEETPDRRSHDPIFQGAAVFGVALAVGAIVTTIRERIKRK